LLIFSNLCEKLSQNKVYIIFSRKLSFAYKKLFQLGIKLQFHTLFLTKRLHIQFVNFQQYLAFFFQKRQFCFLTILDKRTKI